MLKNVRALEQTHIRDLASRFLAEDLATGDITTASCVDEQICGEAQIFSREPSLVVAGLRVCHAVFELCDTKVVFSPYVGEGEEAKVFSSQESPMVPLASVCGRLSALLKAERVALNLFARMCAVATEARLLSCKLAGSGVVLLDTRKTTPGLKILEKYASAVGGARNHRYHLSDGVLIKENHVKAAGGIAEAITRAKRSAPVSLQIEVEVSSLAELKEAFLAGADMIMLDNMSCEDMEACVAYIQKRIPLEASGNITATSIERVAQTGVDYISTSSMFRAPAADLSMLVVSLKQTS